jgi:hypothetical protein
MSVSPANFRFELTGFPSVRRYIAPKLLKLYAKT